MTLLRHSPSTVHLHSLLVFSHTTDALLSPMTHTKNESATEQELEAEATSCDRAGLYTDLLPPRSGSGGGALFKTADAREEGTVRVLQASPRSLTLCCCLSPLLGFYNVGHTGSLNLRSMLESADRFLAHSLIHSLTRDVSLAALYIARWLSGRVGHSQHPTARWFRASDRPWRA